MVRDNEVCLVHGCMLHTGWRRATPQIKRDEQIREDWESGDWTVEELSYFWGLSFPKMSKFLTEVR